MVEKIKNESEDILEENISKLRQIFPNVFSEGKIDFDKLKENIGVFKNTSEDKYTFSWAGRADSIKNIQTPTHGTLIPQKDESINFEDTENIFIEGDNLEVLKLLQKSYTEKIKMIYIDPPYNTGNDFIYKDDFKDSLDSYLEQTGQKNEGVKLVTNPETSGRFHSDWISFMYPRLFLARELLKDDGVIFVSISDHEVHNLRFLMNDIFGEENFMGDIVWNSTKSVTNTALISVSHTHNLVYAKNIEFFTKNRNEFRLPETEEGFDNPDNDERGPWKADPFQVGGLRPNQLYEITNPKTGEVYKPNSGCSWKNEFKVFKELKKENRIVFGKSGEAGPQRKRFLSEAKERGKVTKTLWVEEKTTTNATVALKKLMGGDYFNNPKPVELIQKFIQLGAPHENDIVLDFFAGSGTTGNSIFEMNLEDAGNRKFILVQIPELCPKKSSALEEGFLTIAEISKERIRRVIKKINDENKQQKLNSKQNQDLGFKVFKLTKSNYKVWQDVSDEAKLKEQLKLFEDPLVENYKDIDVIYEIVIKEGYSLNSEIKEVSGTSNKIYKVTDDEFFFYVTLDKTLDEKSLDSLNLDKNTMFVCLDSTINDSQKTNLDKLCKLRTI